MLCLFDIMMQYIVSYESWKIITVVDIDISLSIRLAIHHRLMYGLIHLFTMDIGRRRANLKIEISLKTAIA